MKNYLITLAALSLTLMSCNNQKQAKTVTLGPNPFITHMYTADPSAHVWEDGRLYVYASHDIDPPRGCDLMDRYHVFSTDDMVNWTDHGEILNSSQVSWASCGHPIVHIGMVLIIFTFRTRVVMTGTIPGEWV